MIWSEERVIDLSHKIFNVLKSKGGLEFLDDKKVLSGIKQSIHEFESILTAVDHKIREKIASLKRQIPDGSREWEILYRQYFDEELTKKGL